MEEDRFPLWRCVSPMLTARSIQVSGGAEAIISDRIVTFNAANFSFKA
jgi:hypothetical protein